MFGHLFRRFQHFDQIARAYYGPRPWCYPKCVYNLFIRVNEFIIFRKDLVPTDGDPFAGTEFEIRRMPIEELRARRAGANLPKEFYYDISHGWTTCYVVLHHDELAYIHWVVYSGERSRFFRCALGVAELASIIALPRFRGQGLQVKAQTYTCEAERLRGIKALVTAVHNSNTPSIKNMERTGFVELTRMKCIGRWNRKITVSR